MKLGVLLPTFRHGADDALALAHEAADAGLDGVFAYDHLWPMGSPQRPSLAPFALLATVLSRHQRLVGGPLVARVGLVGTEHLVGQYRTLEALAPGRVIATLGTGDKLSAPENEAYGLAPQSPDERRSMLAATAQALAPSMPVWIGAGAPATNQLASDLGVALNVWGVPASRVREAASSGEVTWAGPVPDDLEATLDELRDAGATWAVLTPDASVERIANWRSRQ